MSGTGMRNRNGYLRDKPCVDICDHCRQMDVLTPRVVAGCTGMWCEQCDSKTENPTQSVGVKHDEHKPRYSLLPPGTLRCVVEVLDYGARKYSPNNWRILMEEEGGERPTRYYDAAMRHIDAWVNGGMLDEESGRPHLAHAICCLLFLLWWGEKTTVDAGTK